MGFSSEVWVRTGRWFVWALLDSDALMLWCFGALLPQSITGWGSCRRSFGQKVDPAAVQ